MKKINISRGKGYEPVISFKQFPEIETASKFKFGSWEYLTNHMNFLATGLNSFVREFENEVDNLLENEAWKI